MLGRQENSTIAASSGMVKLSPRSFSRGLCLLVAFIVIQSSTFAQNGHIIGQIFNARTQQAVSYVNIHIVGEGIDRHEGAGYGGKFFIDDLWEGYYDIHFKVDGYETLTYEGVYVPENKYTILDVRMKKPKKD